MASKIDSFLAKVNSLSIDWERLYDRQYMQELAEKLKLTFMLTYGSEMISSWQCESDHGFAVIPGLIKTKSGNEYVALLDINVINGGELCGIEILNPKYGFVSDEDFANVLTEEEQEEFSSYQYKPLIPIIGDIYTGMYV